MPRVLIVDDDGFFRKVITKLLVGHSYDITAVGGGEEALEILKTKTFDLMVSDVNMTPMDGIELLQKSREAYPEMGVIMLTGHDEIEVAVDAMKKGAFDFLVKPFQMDELFLTVQRSLKYYNASPNDPPLERKVNLLEGLVTESAAMRKVCDMIKRIAPANVVVLLCGETGEDYELIARTLHYYSSRKGEPLMVFDCAAQPAEAVGDKLFGSSGGGSGVFEKAKGGTLFIDNIHAMPLDVQVELLKVIQTEKIKRIGKLGDVETDVRLIVASCKKLDQLAEQGLFSENLYYRLSALCINIPPLRNRAEDIPFLIDQIIHETVKSDADIPAMESSVKNILYRYAWPGNETELKNTVRQMLSQAKDGSITKETLPEKIAIAVDFGQTVDGTPGHQEQVKGQSFKAFLRGKQEKLFGGGESSKET